jgi:hypothetical protein
LTADRPFYPAVSALEISTPLDAFLAFDHQNPTDIDEDTTISSRSIVCCNNCNNSTTASPIDNNGSDLETLDHGDAI